MRTTLLLILVALLSNACITSKACTKLESIDAQESNALDDLNLILKMAVNEGNIDFSPEMKTLRKRLKGSKAIIADGIIAYMSYEKEEGKRLLQSIKEDDPDFEIMYSMMDKVMYASINKFGEVDKDGLNELARLTYETKLRDEQELESGCVHALENYYWKQIQDTPQKKEAFLKWWKQKRQTYFKANKGLWYNNDLRHYIKEDSLQDVNEKVEKVLLGFGEKYEGYPKDLEKIHDLREKAEFVQELSYVSGDNTSNLLLLLEEIRSYVLIGDCEGVDGILESIASKIISYQNSLDKKPNRKSEEALGELKILWGKYYYIKGLKLYFVGVDFKEQGIDSMEIIVGRKGAAAQLGFCGLRGSETWQMKSKKLYDYLRKKVPEWYSRNLKEFPMRKEYY